MNNDPSINRLVAQYMRGIITKSEFDMRMPSHSCECECHECIVCGPHELPCPGHRNGLGPTE
ncbi:MAG: hypothetical protein E6R03_12675 [Hyphomicrobiaceae bacterium]|nr:MAG: hypothetical protein E6R03_12675 [Hyphomicrobiaceae bacterium]